VQISFKFHFTKTLIETPIKIIPLNLPEMIFRKIIIDPFEYNFESFYDTALN